MNKFVRKLTTLEEFKAKALKNSRVQAEYDALEDEFRLLDQLVGARLAKKMTQADLAHKVGMQQAAIARLESGQTNPTFTTLSKIAKALDKKVSLV